MNFYRQTERRPDSSINDEAVDKLDFCVHGDAESFFFD